jgi:hypothetical protein
MTASKFIGFTVFATFIVLACGCRPFQPPNNEDDLWHQRGKSRIDVKKSLLECGFADTSGHSMDPSIDFLAACVCMERIGYTREITRLGDVSPICENGWAKKSPECQPSAVIPTPSVERRLNSKSCQSKSKYNRPNRPECQP